MTCEEVIVSLEALEYETLTSPSTGRLLYELVSREGVSDVLELGFANGTSTAYMAAALDEKKRGSIVTIDRPDALERHPDIHTVLGSLGLRPWVTPIVTPTSYTWELLKMLEANMTGAQTRRCFDFCFLDGSHTWETDGFAFLLVDRLLRLDRWIVFDDVAWSFETSPTLRRSERTRRMSPDERATQQIRKVVDLLVRPAGYEVRIVGNVALAYKPGPDGGGGHRDDFDLLVDRDDRLVWELAVPVPPPVRMTTR